MFGVRTGLSVAGAIAMAGGPATHFNPPVIREPFSPLPCKSHPISTLDLEGCGERALLASDYQINARVARIFAKIPTRSRGTFVHSELSWLTYRRATCRAQISNTAGGSGQPVRYLACEVERNRTHLTDLTHLLQELSEH